jgi:hypothetical protein
VPTLVCVRVVPDSPPARCRPERKRENRYRVYRYVSYLTRKGVSRWKLDVFRSDRGKEFLVVHVQREQSLVKEFGELPPLGRAHNRPLDADECATLDYAQEHGRLPPWKPAHVVAFREV